MTTPLRKSGNDFGSHVIQANQTFTIGSDKKSPPPPAPPAHGHIRIWRDTTYLRIEATGSSAPTDTALNFLSEDMPIGTAVFLRVLFNPLTWFLDGDSQEELPGDSFHCFVVNDAGVWERLSVEG